ncbi:MAG: glutamylcysteine synthetase [Lachnospiraceae bacterium]|nr:glutamylcysteine synthetase [Lachnospiraceae bacterium]
MADLAWQYTENDQNKTVDQALINDVKEALYEKYIAPTRKTREHYIGIEIEMPILNLNKKPVDFRVIHRLTADFMQEFQFTVLGKDEEGNIYSAEDLKTGDIFSYDCSYNNLELSMGKERELHTIRERFTKYYSYIQSRLTKENYTLSGFGVNPYRGYNHNVPILNGRYRMLFHHLHSYKEYSLPMYFHEYPAYGTFCSASQVQLDVEYENLIETINTFTRLEPIKALLFSNSILLDEHEELLCCRDMFWENSTHGINSHNIGMYELEFHSVQELQKYIESTSIYCVERGSKYINFPPIPILEYFTKEVVMGEYYDGTKYCKIGVHPKLSDLNYLRTFKFEDLTYRGTIEYRSVCCQPIHDFMTVAAFHIGLTENLHGLTALLDQDQVLYHRGYNAGELRKLFNYRDFPSGFDKDQVYDLAQKIVDLAEDGLRKRGQGEEVYLAPLHERIRQRSNPSLYVLNAREQGVPLETIIREFAEIE